MNTSSTESKTVRRKRGPIRLGLTLAVVAAMAAITQTPAFADGPAYGSAVSCPMDSKTTVTVQPHFVQTGSQRRLDGYAYYTSPAPGLVVNEVRMRANVTNTSMNVGSTITQPNATKATRTNLSAYYSSQAAGTVTVQFQMIFSAGAGCIAVTTV